MYICRTMCLRMHRLDVHYKVANGTTHTHTHTHIHRRTQINTTDCLSVESNSLIGYISLRVSSLPLNDLRYKPTTFQTQETTGYDLFPQANHSETPTLRHFFYYTSGSRVGTISEERRHHLHVPKPRGGVERRSPVDLARANAPSGREDGPDLFRPGVVGYQEERGHPVHASVVYFVEPSLRHPPEQLHLPPRAQNGGKGSESRIRHSNYWHHQRVFVRGQGVKRRNNEPKHSSARLLAGSGIHRAM